MLRQNISEEIISYLDNISLYRDIKNLGKLRFSPFYEEKNKSWFILFFKEEKNNPKKIIGFWWSTPSSKNKKALDKIEEEASLLKINDIINGYMDIQCYIYYFPDNYAIYSLANKINKELRNESLSLLLYRKDSILVIYEIFDFIKENLSFLAVIFSVNFFILAAFMYISKNTILHISRIPQIFPYFFNNSTPDSFQYYSVVTASILFLVVIFVGTLSFLNAIVKYIIRCVIKKPMKNCANKYKHGNIFSKIYDLFDFLLIEIPLISMSLIIEAIFSIYFNSTSPFLKFTFVISGISVPLALLFSKKALSRSHDYPYIYYLLFFTILIITDTLFIV
ncbi:MAG: hypothetical protein ACYCSB_04210 [bacterium]